MLDKNESNTNPQEFCEANRLFIGGNVVVNSNTTSNAVVWFTGTNSALTVEENAYFEVNALSTYFFILTLLLTSRSKKVQKLS